MSKEGPRSDDDGLSFAHAHLPPHLQAIGQPYDDEVRRLGTMMPPGPHRAGVVTKVYEAKEAAIRAMLDTCTWDAIACRWVQRGPKAGPAVQWNRTTGA